MEPIRGETAVLISLPTEYEAVLMVQALEARGIQAYADGALTSGFRAEAPGEVKVIVRQSNLVAARAFLCELGKS